MVVKQGEGGATSIVLFESSVIPYGSKTCACSWEARIQFESSVIPYGSKTKVEEDIRIFLFESSVIPYGSKTMQIYLYETIKVWE